MEEVALVFPHQLFKDSPLAKLKCTFILVEEYLFFRQYPFHKQKLLFHRAGMKSYERFLKSLEKEVIYVNAQDSNSDIRALIPYLIQSGVKKIHCIDPTDHWLEKRIKHFRDKVEILWYMSPLFLNTPEDLSSYFSPEKKSFFQTAFYKNQRKSRNILMDSGEPTGGRWTFDSENRKKYPANKKPVGVHFPENTPLTKASASYVENHFSDHHGILSFDVQYPVTFEEAEQWLDQFLNFRFHEFGTYQDALVARENFMHHSILSPLLNTGLLLPGDVLSKALSYAKEHRVPLNSVEGFVRQILGWREFIRGVYAYKGVKQRTTNFWGHHRSIPASFYNGTTGIPPIDITIQKTLKTGYAHHIERLMVLSNFMLLCEFHPDQVYRWFMEMFIDSYDWVMVPNVYGMSLFADGGIMSTKPYISGSNYLIKMGDYPKSEWQSVWDALFWNFVFNNREVLNKNPRTKLMVSNFDRMDKRIQEKHLVLATDYLNKLSHE